MNLDLNRAHASLVETSAAIAALDPAVLEALGVMIADLGPSQGTLWTMGNGGADTIVGGNGNDYLDGGIGDDMLSGGADNDTYKVDSAGDSVTEASAQGNDTIDAALASLTLALSARMARA